MQYDSLNMYFSIWLHHAFSRKTLFYLNSYSFKGRLYYESVNFALPVSANDTIVEAESLHPTLRLEATDFTFLWMVSS